MNIPFGFSRDVVKRRYALRTPEGFVPGNLPGWRNAACVVQISPGMGANFSQVLVTMNKNSEGRGGGGPAEMLVYVMMGIPTLTVAGKTHRLNTGSYAYLPSGMEFHFRNSQAQARLLIFEKKFEPLSGTAAPGIVIGHEERIKGQPFLGNKDARLQVLLPDQMAFDMAVNIFTFAPGATLPLVETHIMEHGLVMLKGQGIYRLDHDWHPVQAGDVIWMAPYCPQWFAAIGGTSASYIYYKNINRAPG
jgi:(S)-ureidoglycine aminohydrolase